MIEKRSVAALLILMGATCFAAKFHNVPDASLGGGITAAVTPIGELEQVIVIEPVEYKVYVAQIDRGGNRFVLRGIPPGKYDILLKFKSVVAEGIKLDVRGGYEKLSPEDREGIEHVTFISEDYFNMKNMTRMGGNSKRVKMVVEQVRDKATVDPSGKALAGIMIRRIDLTEMRKAGRIWQITKNRHLFREERKMGGPGTKLKFMYVPSLGGVRVGDEVETLPKIELSKLKQKWAPHFYRASRGQR